MRMKVTYTDGHDETVPITCLDQAKSEEQAAREKWGGMETSQFRRSFYAIYWHLRHTGGTAIGFEEWLETVTDIAQETEAPKA